MSRIIDIYYDETNKEVTLFYLSIIDSFLKNKGFETRLLPTPVISKTSNYGAVVIYYADVEKAKEAGYKKIIFWMQGIAPEELFLKDRNILKFIVHSIGEKRALHNSNLVFFCSDFMKKHCKKKYFAKLKKFYIMPCFNEEIDEQSILHKDYSNNEFVYAGSLARYQCFEKIVILYKRIEEKREDTFFSIYVSDKEKAELVLKKHGVKNYRIDYVSSAELGVRLLSAKFGFCIRDNISVNKVATPTKLSNYVAHGIIPIYSRSINSFYNQSRGCKYSLCADDKKIIEKILQLCDSKSINKEVLEDFKRVYKDYYSAEFYIKDLSDTIDDF